MTSPSLPDASARPLRDTHAAITGASRGIGRAIALQLAAMGAGVTLLGRDRAALEQVAGEVASGGGRAQVVTLDLAQPQTIAPAFEAAVQGFGAVTHLVNNAGVAKAAPALRTDPEAWQQMLAVDLTGPWLCIQQVLRGMQQAPYGRIVNVASTAGLTGYAYVAAYCAAKHGLIGVTRALAMELAKSRVTVNAVCPGYTDTDIVARSVADIVAKTGRTAEQALAELVRHNPQARLVQPDEVAQAVAWLCLPGSASVTGQSIVVAGGELM